MNDKQNELLRIVDIVAQCCTYGREAAVTRSDLLGRSKKESHCMARIMLVSQLRKAGYSVSTMAGLLGRTAAAVRQMLRKHWDYEGSSRAYRIALGEVRRLGG